MEICETQFLSKIMKNRRVMILLGTVIFIVIFSVKKPPAKPVE